MKKLLAVIILMGATVVVVLGHWAREGARADGAIATLQDWSKGTDDQQRAIHVLEGAKGASITSRLIQVMSDPKTRPDVQVMVASILAHRNQPEVTVALSEVLLPQNSLYLRREAVDALQGRQCSEPCIRNILHYRERLWWGELPSELAAMQTPSSAEDFKQLESQLDDGMDAILLNNRSSTLEQLGKVYGLGSMHPSRFGIGVAQRLDLREACRGLTRQYLRESSNQDTQRALDAAIEKLGCRANH